MYDLVNLISIIVFPIVACLFMFNQNQKLTETITDLKVTLSGIEKRLEAWERKEI